MAPFVSPQSFRFLLHLASFRTDQRLVRSLLSEMHERDVPIDDEARRVLLRGYVRAGMHDAVGEVARAVREAEGRAPVLLPTAKRDLSDKGKGKADLQPGWKGWAARERVQRVEEQVLRAASKVEEELIGHTMRSTQKRRRMRSAVATEAGPSTFALPRHPTLIPPRPASLAGSDVATLVERLVQERRTDEAISLAEMWLEAHRPSYLDSPPSTALRPAETPLIRYNRLVRQYYSTALVLLNILLKLLYQERPTPSSIRLFVDGFITRHSAPAPAAPLTPNLVTLRQLVVGLLGQAAAWDRAVALVDWFGYRWGIPTTSHASSPRAHFVPPSKIEADRVGLVVGESRAAADAATADAQAAHLSLVAPHNAVPPDVAILLLRHATDQYERGTLGHKARVAAVRAWWARFDKQSSDAWTIARHERVIARAKSLGLLEGSTVVSKRRWVRAAAKPGGKAAPAAWLSVDVVSPFKPASESGADIPKSRNRAVLRGEAALASDAVFHLYPAGDRPSPALYLSTLETFLRDHLPPAHSNEADPSALIHALRSYFPAPLPGAVRPPPAIPRTVWHTAPADEAFKRKKDTLRSWTEKNNGWTVVRHNDSQADAWVRRRFALDSNDGGAHGVVAAWDRLAEPAVLRSDFWRYLVLAVEGGVYADTDVQCLQAVERWGDDASWKGERPEGYAAPSLVVGVEADVGNRHDWHNWWPRPLQISQWTMASARGHPVLLDTIRRIVESALLPDDEQPKSVMEKTGPGPFTDAVLSYLAVQYRKPWGTLRGLDSDGYRFRASVDAPALVSSGSGRDRRSKERWGDVKVLSITGFSPGVGHMGAHDRNHPAAMAFHAFAGSWRKQPGADA
ncbi:hypothetical protein Rhopal_000817-T1 [Rhodotorula paludigena]|uniref:Initiation-specific alpha-1,6-mannosyltransferase n=1 Tax=Rhodotorula paludigena TaxID=86838 RepID=A0AAV5GFM8_9BASI|nr:hypothetical protein Rhopal_000817-T1 [Rhodotorula paludigena]